MGHLFEVMKKRTHVFQMLLTSYPLLITRYGLFPHFLPRFCCKMAASFDEVVFQLGKDGIKLIMVVLRQLMSSIFTRWTNLLRKGMRFFIDVPTRLFASHCLDQIFPIILS